MQPQLVRPVRRHVLAGGAGPGSRRGVALEQAINRLGAVLSRGDGTLVEAAFQTRANSRRCQGAGNATQSGVVGTAAAGAPGTKWRSRCRRLATPQRALQAAHPIHFSAISVPALQRVDRAQQGCISRVAKRPMALRLWRAWWGWAEGGWRTCGHAPEAPHAPRQARTSGCGPGAGRRQSRSWSRMQASPCHCLKNGARREGGDDGASSAGPEARQQHSSLRAGRSSAAVPAGPHWPAGAPAGRRPGCTAGWAAHMRRPSTARRSSRRTQS